MSPLRILPFSSMLTPLLPIGAYEERSVLRRASCMSLVLYDLPESGGNEAGLPAN
jgi:hypothetical protein